MDKKKIAIELGKLGLAALIGGFVTKALWPNIKTACKLDAPTVPDTIPSEDIEDEDIDINE